MQFFARLITTTLAVLIVSYILPGIKVENVITAILFSVVLALLNTVLKPVIVLFTLPLTVITLGLFLIIINGLMILLAAEIVPGFHVDGFWWAVLFSIILSLVVSLLNSLGKSQ
jgi:putative membrane protein